MKTTVPSAAIIERFAVFDGMGGEECGEIASFLAADLLFKLWNTQAQYYQSN